MATFTEAYHTTRAKARTRTGEPILVRLGRVAGALMNQWQAVRTPVLAVAGLGLICAAGWVVTVPLGLATTGLALLVLEAIGGNR